MLRSGILLTHPQVLWYARSTEAGAGFGPSSRRNGNLRDRQSGPGTSGEPFRQALKAFSSQAGFIPEQVWNITANVTGWETVTPPPYTPGTATRSMQPLSWAMGEYITLWQQ